MRVEGAQQRRLATARRADERRDLLLRDVERDVLERLEAAVVEVEIAHRQLGLLGHRAVDRGVHGCEAQALLRKKVRARMFNNKTPSVIRNTPAQASFCQFS